MKLRRFLFFLAESPAKGSAIGHYFKESYSVGANCIRRHDYKMNRLQDAYGIRQHEEVGAIGIRRLGRETETVR